MIKINTLLLKLIYQKIDCRWQIAGSGLYSGIELSKQINFKFELYPTYFWTDRKER